MSAYSLDGAVVVVEAVQRHHQLAGLRAGDPRVGVDAADAESRHDEVVPPRFDQVLTGPAAHGAAEHRVVPVHREASTCPGTGRGARAARGRAGRRRAPTRAAARPSGRPGRRPPAATGRCSTAGEQRSRLTRAGPSSSHSCDQAMPPNGSCMRDDEVEPAAYDRPHPLHERQVAPEHPVVPHAHREVGRHVRLAAGVLDLTRDDLHRPRAVVRAAAPAPLVGRLGGLELRRRPSIAIAASTWFHASTCSPAVHGIAPSAPASRRSTQRSAPPARW